MPANAVQFHPGAVTAGAAAVAPAWLSHLAHDLRGPLSPLANALALLRSGRLDALQQAETCSLAQQQIEVLSQLLDDTAELLALKPRNSVLPVEFGNLLDMVKVRISRRLYANGSVLEITAPQHSVEVTGDLCGLVRLLTGLLLRCSAIAGAGSRLHVGARRIEQLLDPVAPQLAIRVQGGELHGVGQLSVLAATLTASSQIHVADAALARVIAAHGLLLRALPCEDGAELLLEWPHR